MDSIKTVFEKECADLDLGPKLVKRLTHFQQSFVHKNADHIAFFGGNLTGVQTVRFLDSDRDRWFDEILEADPQRLEEQLLALPTVNPEFHVSSDTFNLSCVWLTHALYASPKLSPQLKHDGMVAVLLMLQYKFFTSRYFRHFKYPADKAVAEATYAQLSYKFALKQHGSWDKYFRARTEEILSEHALHAAVIHQMDSDPAVIYMLNDTQGRIRDMLKNIYGVFLEVHAQGSKIVSTSQVVEYDGEAILKDKTRNLTAYVRYLHSIISDQPSFVRPELVAVVENLMTTMSPRFFQQSLAYMSNNYRQARASEIEDVLNEVLVHSFEYLNENRAVIRNERNLPGLLSKLRGVYMSSRSTDPALFSLRAKVEKIVRDATGNSNESQIASVRTGVLLYLVARTFSMHHYTAS